MQSILGEKRGNVGDILCAGCVRKHVLWSIDVQKLFDYC